jgi:hypothetical protein
MGKLGDNTLKIWNYEGNQWNTHAEFGAAHGSTSYVFLCVLLPKGNPGSAEAECMLFAALP